eukprot:scaffold110318_cov30-Phaeocystis_antarctica.AAC.2
MESERNAKAVVKKFKKTQVTLALAPALANPNSNPNPNPAGNVFSGQAQGGDRRAVQEPGHFVRSLILTPNLTLAKP